MAFSPRCGSSIAHDVFEGDGRRVRRLSACDHKCSTMANLPGHVGCRSDGASSGQARRQQRGRFNCVPLVGTGQSAFLPSTTATALGSSVNQKGNLAVHQCHKQQAHLSKWAVSFLCYHADLNWRTRLLAQEDATKALDEAENRVGGVSLLLRRAHSANKTTAFRHSLQDLKARVDH